MLVTRLLTITKRRSTLFSFSFTNSLRTSVAVLKKKKFPKSNNFNRLHCIIVVNLSSTKNLFISALFELLMATKLAWTRRLLPLAVTVAVIFHLRNIINCAAHEVLPFHPCFTISFIYFHVYQHLFVYFHVYQRGKGSFSLSSFFFCFVIALF